MGTTHQVNEDFSQVSTMAWGSKIQGKCEEKVVTIQDNHRIGGAGTTHQVIEWECRGTQAFAGSGIATNWGLVDSNRGLHAEGSDARRGAVSGA
jgi:hypothetical protein